MAQCSVGKETGDGLVYTSCVTPSSLAGQVPAQSRASGTWHEVAHVVSSLSIFRDGGPTVV